MAATNPAPVSASTQCRSRSTVLSLAQCRSSTTTVVRSRSASRDNRSTIAASSRWRRDSGWMFGSGSWSGSATAIAALTRHSAGGQRSDQGREGVGGDGTDPLVQRGGQGPVRSGRILGAPDPDHGSSLGLETVRQLLQQPGLPDAWLTLDESDPLGSAARGQPDQVIQVVGSAHEGRPASRLSGKVGPVWRAPVTGRQEIVERRIVRDDKHLQSTQVLSGLQPHLPQTVPRLVEDLQASSPLLEAVQRQNTQPPPSLPEGLCLGEAGEDRCSFGDASGPDQRLAPSLLNRRAQLVEAFAVEPGDVDLVQLEPRIAAPQRQSPLRRQDRRPGRAVGAEDGERRRNSNSRPIIGVAGVVEHVAVSLPPWPVAAEQGAKPHGVVRHAVGSRRRRIPGPQRVDEHGHPNRSRLPEDQAAEHPSQRGRADLDRLTRDLDRQRTQDTDPHRCSGAASLSQRARRLGTNLRPTMTPPTSSRVGLSALRTTARAVRELATT
jgi:hypothetical protein